MDLPRRRRYLDLERCRRFRCRQPNPFTAEQPRQATANGVVKAACGFTDEAQAAIFGDLRTRDPSAQGREKYAVESSNCFKGSRFKLCRHCRPTTDPDGQEPLHKADDDEKAKVSSPRKRSIRTLRQR